MTIENPRRALNFIGFLVCAGLLAYAYYLQFHEGLEPCPLCIFQRIGVIIVGLLFLLATLFSFRGRGARIWGVLIGLFALAGALTSARHLWVQMHPDAVASCGPNLGYMMKTLPIFEVVKRVFTGSGDCAIVHWTFLGLSMPGWTLIWFVLLGTFGVWVNWRRLPAPVAALS
jgi:disulfide bond formation protein DsbB